MPGIFKLDGIKSVYPLNMKLITIALLLYISSAFLACNHPKTKEKPHKTAKHNKTAVKTVKTGISFASESSAEADIGPSARNALFKRISTDDQSGKTFKDSGVMNIDDIISGLVQGNLHAALVSPVGLVRLEQKIPDIKLIALIEPYSEISVRREGCIVARASSGISSTEELKGTRFAYTDKTSTAGYLYPMSLFISMGVEPKYYFEELAVCDTSLNCLSRLHQSQLDAASLSCSDIDKAEEAGMSRESFTILARSLALPPAALVMSSTVDKSVFMHIFNEVQSGVIERQFKASPPDMERYDIIRNMYSLAGANR